MKLQAAAEEKAAQEVQRARVAAEEAAAAQAKAVPYPSSSSAELVIAFDNKSSPGEKVLKLCELIVTAESAKLKEVFGTKEEDTQKAAEHILSTFLKACDDLRQKDELLPEATRAETFEELASMKKDELKALIKEFAEEEQQWLQIEQEHLAAPLVPKSDSSAVGEALAELKNQQQTGRLPLSLKQLQDSLTLQIDSLKQFARQAGSVLDRAKSSSMTLAKEVMDREMSLFPHVQSPEVRILLITLVIFFLNLTVP